MRYDHTSVQAMGLGTTTKHTATFEKFKLALWPKWPKHLPVPLVQRTATAFGGVSCAELALSNFLTSA